MAQKHRLAADYLLMVVMASLMALNYQIFILHNAFAPAGLNGLATMVQYVFHFSVGYMSLLTNIPLAIAAFFLVDRQFAFKSLLYALTFSFMLLLLQNNIIDVERFVYHTEDGKSTLLAPIASGFINGFIYSVAIRRGGCTGGTDFVAAYVHKVHPEYSLMHVIFALNVGVAVLSYFVYGFNIEPVILCIAYSFITSNVSDNLLKGGKQAWKIEMITSHPREVTEALIKELRHSVTIVNVEGGYSHQPKTMLICIINKHQITRFTEIISRFPDTFACVSNVNETLGNFKHISK